MKVRNDIKGQDAAGLKERSQEIEQELKNAPKKPESASKPTKEEKPAEPTKEEKPAEPIKEEKPTEPAKEKTAAEEPKPEPAKEEPKKAEIKGKFAQRLQDFLEEGKGKEIPDAERRTWIEEGKKFQEIAESDPQRIGDILRGDEPLPEGMTPGVFIKQAALYLKDNPDIDLMQDFANNVLQGQISEAARITASGRAISNDVFTENIKEAQTAVKRGVSDAILEKRKESIIKDAKDYLDKNLEGKTLEDFLDENAC